MPVYLYQVILDDDVEGPVFEVEQPMSAPALTKHPVTGHRVRRVYEAPTLTTRHTAGQEKRMTENKTVEQAGFTKYERDKLTGRYHKVAGQDARAPESFEKD